MNITKYLLGTVFLSIFTSNTFADVTGSDTYFALCAGCHQRNGEGIPNIFPSLKTSVIVTTSLQDMVNTVVKGKRGTAMQAFGLQLDQTQIISVINHIRNSIGNIKTTKNDITPLVKTAIKELKKEVSANNKKLNKLKTELNNLLTPSSLFAKSYSYETNNMPLAQEGYNLLIQKFPDSDLMLKAVERLDKINSKYGK